MAVTTTYEVSLLQPFEAAITNAVRNTPNEYEGRLQLLEFWASTIGGFDYADYCASFQIATKFESALLYSVSEKLTLLAENIDVDKSLIIAALSREPLDRAGQKEVGAYYTDYRLAMLIGNQSSSVLSKESTVADLSSGSGILLAAVAATYKQKYPEDTERWLNRNVYAYDLSEYALRGCRIALSSYLSDVKGIKAMSEKWRIADSLLDDNLPARKFDLVVGNPPWGKVKLTRHTYIVKNGNGHTYGAEYEPYDNDHFTAEKKKLADYNKRLREQYDWLQKTESDTYIAFLQRAFGAVKEYGRVLILLPAGIIRSKGTTAIREELTTKCSHLSFVIISNRARFFAIDTRFKFVLLDCDFAEKASLLDSIKLSHCDGTKNEISVSEPVTISVPMLRKARPDLTLPEVRSAEERELYFRIYENGCDWSSSPDWACSISRELDMTNDKGLFYTKPNGATIAVVEGRMVQQHWFAVKKYVSGTGRAARWEPANGELKPQFWMNPKDLSKEFYARVQRERVGYCDIAGQTNERAMMSCILPAGVACGNKVPTILFENSSDGRRELLWVGITNSFVYDWLLRRIISTTANYFMILSVPMPEITIDSEHAEAVITATQTIRELRSAPKADEMKIAALRRQIDIAVALAYGLSYNDLCLIMEDFPLLDRKQPSLKGEKRSTVTRDYLLSGASRRYGVQTEEYSKRYQTARKRGATPYIPTDIVGERTGEFIGKRKHAAGRG